MRFLRVALVLLHHLVPSFLKILHFHSLNCTLMVDIVNF